LERGRRNLVRRDLCFAGKLASSYQVLVALEPEQAATKPVGDEFALAGIKPEALSGDCL
jgi:hypothetical protein